MKNKWLMHLQFAILPHTAKEERSCDRHVFWLTAFSLPPTFPWDVTEWLIKEVVAVYSGGSASDFHGFPFAISHSHVMLF